MTAERHLVQVVQVVHIPTLDEIPRRDYFPASFYEGDVREVAKLMGVEPFECRDDLGPHLAVPIVADGIAMQLVGPVPFIEQGFEVAADRAEMEAARRVSRQLLEQLGYPVVAVPIRYADGE